MSHRPRLRRLVAAIAAAGVTTAPAVLMPTTAAAQPCSVDAGCRQGNLPKGDRLTGWVTYADKDGRGSYSTWTVYVRDREGHCFDLRGVGVGCPG